MKIFGVEGKTTPPGKLKEGCLTMKPIQLLPPPFLPPPLAKPIVPRQACFPFVNLCEQLFCRGGWCPTCKLRLPIKSENKPLQSVIRNYVAMMNEEMTHQGNDTPGKSRVSNPLHPQMNSVSTVLPVAPPRNPAPLSPAAPPGLFLPDGLLPARWGTESALAPPTVPAPAPQRAASAGSLYGRRSGWVLSSR